MRHVRSCKVLIGIGAMCLALHATGTAVRASEPLDEGDLKALFLLNFARFTTWPEEAGRTNAFVLCYLREDASHLPLHAMEGESIRGRPIEIMRCAVPRDAEQCDLLYLNTADSAVVEDFLEDLRGKPVLTVTNLRGGAQKGAMIGFFLAGQKLRFEINMSQVRASGLSMSSHLLGLARIIDDEPAPDEGAPARKQAREEAGYE